MHRANHSITLYSSTIATTLLMIASLLNSFASDPQKADPVILSNIQQQLQQIAVEIQKTMPNDNQGLTIMGWVYPGPPACIDLELEAGTLSGLEVVKPEYFAVRAGGELEFMTAEKYGCNGYSQESVAKIKAIAPKQFVTVSSASGQDMSKFLDYDETTNEHTKNLVTFVHDHGFHGVELDFEGMGSWTDEHYRQYIDFIERLGKALRARNKQLMVDVPPVSNASEEQWYHLRLEDLEARGVDYIVVMGYDYHYDHGVGEPVAPLAWLAEVVNFTKAKVKDDQKIVIGLPVYGYVGDKATGKISILTKEQAEQHPLFGNSARRDVLSKELFIETSGHVLVYQDEVSIAEKLKVVHNNGIKSVSLWHLGGNVWPKSVL